MTRKIAQRIQVGVAVAVLGLGLTAGTAIALEGCPNSDCGEVQPNNDQTTPPGGATEGETLTASPAAPAANAGTSGGALPFTGADVVELSIIGLGAIGTGTIMVRRSRAHRVTP